jgi:hypothetical protein
MFDNLRQKSAEEAEFLKNAEAAPAPEAPDMSGQGSAGRKKRTLTPFQRFVLALMLFLNVSILGCIGLLVFEKIVLPGF